jgi:Tfp pilus assembly protein PilF
MSLAEKIVKEDPESINKDIPVMVSEFKKAVRLDPENISAKKNLIYSYLFADDLKSAQKETEELLKADPQNEFAVKMKELLSEETP